MKKSKPIILRSFVNHGLSQQHPVTGSNQSLSKMLLALIVFIFLSAPSALLAQVPYLLGIDSTVNTIAILTANDAVGQYKMSGTPDGLGAYDNGDGTFTLLMNHEFGNTAGVARAHGSIGSFISKWIINKSDLSVVSGSDLIQNVYLWNAATSDYSLYNSSNPSSLAAFNRFCSADLPAVSAYYNSVSGLGTMERIFMNGEESGSEGRAMAHVATGSNAGTSWELPALGKASWENLVASAYESDKTVVGGMDDASTNGQIYFYIGTKSNSGTEIEKAGLTNGNLYVVSVPGFPQERINSTTINNPPAPGSPFQLVNLGDVSALTGSTINTNSVNAGATSFARPEDGAWDPSNPGQDFYFNTTDQIDQVNDGLGTQVGRSRVWHLHFTDPANPEAGGTIEAVIDGTEGINMLDNMAIDRNGHIIMQEDVGNSAHNGKIWQYTIASDELRMIVKHDPDRFGDITIAATAPFNQDEESSGMVDVAALLGPGIFLFDDQAHYNTDIPVDIVEGGQLLAMYNANTANCNDFNLALSTAGDIDLCDGESASLFANGGYGFTYQWYRSGITLVGATNATYNTDKKGAYYVVASNGTCSWTSPVATVNTYAQPTAAIQARLGLDACTYGSVVLKATGGTGSYAWYKDGSVLAGVTTKLISVTDEGSYAVEITNANGCADMSAPVTVTNSCKLGQQVESNYAISVFPNPASGDFKVQLTMNSNFSGIAQIEVINLLGQVVYNNQTQVNGGAMDATVSLKKGLDNGNYFVKVIAADQVFIKQIVFNN